MVARLRTHCSTCGSRFAAPQVGNYCDQICRGNRQIIDAEADQAAELLRLERARELLPAYLRPEIERRIAAVHSRRVAAGAS